MNIIKKYNVTCAANDPSITFKLPGKILKDLVLRAEENGRTVEVEIAIRLARTLERDLEMIEEDNNLAVKAFERMTQDEK